MKPSLCLVGVALMVFVALEQSSSAQDLAFVGVNVVPMNRNGILNNQTVIVRDGRIADVGPAASTRVPDGALRVEGRGKYLMPGLGEMHGHIPSPLEPREFIEAVLFLYVANGVTTVRGMQGAPGQLEFREKAKRGELLAPNLYLAGPPFSGKTIKSVEEAIQRVRQQKAEGWDLLKVLPGLARDHLRRLGGATASCCAPARRTRCRALRAPDTRGR